MTNLVRPLQVGARKVNATESLTSGYTWGTDSAFVTNQLNIQAFVTDFQFELSKSQCCGITFRMFHLGSDAPRAVGPTPWIVKVKPSGSVN